MSYRYRFTLPKHIILRKYKSIIAVLALLLFIVIAIYLAFVWYISNENSQYQPQTEIRSASYTPLQKFQTQHFSFEADNSWSFIEKESSANIFVYRSEKNNIVSRDFTVYVNTLPQNLLVTRVLPLEPDGNKFSVSEVSEHCKEYLKDRISPGNNNPIVARIESVQIKCQVDGTSTTVGTGQVNGNYQVELKAGNGSTNKYFIVYNDLEFTPRLNTFINIVRSFRAI